MYQFTKCSLPSHSQTTRQPPQTPTIFTFQVITFKSIYHSIRNHKRNTNPTTDKGLFIDIHFKFAISIRYTPQKTKNVRNSHVYWGYNTV